MRRIVPLVAAAALMPAAALRAAPLTIAKSSAVVADAVNTLNPKALPGAVVEYALLVRNPNSVVSGMTVRSVVISDVVPANTVFAAADLTAGAGPIDFIDGNLLGLGLLGSGLAFTFRGLADDTDSVEFFNGVTWAYHPVAGYDPNVKAFRVTLTGTQAATSAFRLRFRVQLK